MLPSSCGWRWLPIFAAEMAEAKTAQAGAVIERPDITIPVWLLYGPDAGMVSERADVLSGKFGVDLKDPFSLVRMDADNAAESGRLAEEAGTIGMFGGGRLIRVSGSTRRNLADAVRPLLEKPPVDCWVIIEAGDLKRESALRRQVEKSPAAMAIPCYPDTDRDIERLINGEMKAAGLAIEPDAVQALLGSLGSDRRMTRNEITKLALYCEGMGKVTLADVQALVGDTSAIVADDLIDAAASGDAASLNELLPRLLSRISGDMLLLAALRHFQALQQARHRMDTNRAAAQAVTASMRPPLHFSRKAAFERALGIWNAASISKALVRLDASVFQARSNGTLGGAIAGHELLAIANEAARLGKRRN